jgi:DNA-binding NarL/FixJ family response regulator
MINAGVCGYVAKSGAAQDLVEAIRTGSRGKVYFSEEIADTAEGIQNKKGKSKNNSSQTERPLTQREREVLQLIGEGHSSVEIASKLKICETTVKTHRNNLMDKLYGAVLCREFINRLTLFVDEFQSRSAATQG